MTTKLATRAGFSGSSDVWIEANAPTLEQAEGLHALYSSAPLLAEALQQLTAAVDADHSGQYRNTLQKARHALTAAGLTH